MLQDLLEIGTLSRTFGTFQCVTRSAYGIITSKQPLTRLCGAARISVLPHSTLRTLYRVKPKTAASAISLRRLSDSRG